MKRFAPASVVDSNRLVASCVGTCSRTVRTARHVRSFVTTRHAFQGVVRGCMTTIDAEIKRFGGVRFDARSASQVPSRSTWSIWSVPAQVTTETGM